MEMQNKIIQKYSFLRNLFGGEIIFYVLTLIFPFNVFTALLNSVFKSGLYRITFISFMFVFFSEHPGVYSPYINWTVLCCF